MIIYRNGVWKTRKIRNVTKNVEGIRNSRQAQISEHKITKSYMVV